MTGHPGWDLLSLNIFTAVQLFTRYYLVQQWITCDYGGTSKAVSDCYMYICQVWGKTWPLPSFGGSCNRYCRFLFTWCKLLVTRNQQYFTRIKWNKCNNILNVNADYTGYDTYQLWQALHISFLSHTIFALMQCFRQRGRFAEVDEGIGSWGRWTVR